MIPFLDCQGLAGAWTLGTVRTGRFRLTHRVSLPGGFGDPVIEANRHLITGAWQQEVEDWTPQTRVGFLCGTPPCSGFSSMNTVKGMNARGSSSAINNCMKELVIYAGKCTGLDDLPGPEIVAFESVQAAYSAGRDLMQHLRGILENSTGLRYNLTHVLMSGSTVGAAQMRHRYFFVAHRIPFGADPPEPRKVATYGDAIGDLIGANLQWEDQAYPDEMPSDWIFEGQKRRADGMFASHVTIKDSRRLSPVLQEIWHEWEPSESIVQACNRLDHHPPELAKFREPDHPNGYRRFNWPKKIDPSRPGYVLAGSGISDYVHWAEPRFLTVTECARLMGYPDNWDWTVAQSPAQASAWIGKCCPVESGTWLSSHVANAIEGYPGRPGKEIGDREYLLNYTNLYKDWPGGRRQKPLLLRV